MSFATYCTIYKTRTVAAHGLEQTAGCGLVGLAAQQAVEPVFEIGMLLAQGAVREAGAAAAGGDGFTFLVLDNPREVGGG